jgi:hypothetical protein
MTTTTTTTTKNKKKRTSTTITPAAREARDYFRQGIPITHRGIEDFATAIRYMERAILNSGKPLATAKACLRKLSKLPVTIPADGRPPSVPAAAATYDDDGFYNGVPAGYHPETGEPLHGNIKAEEYDRELLRVDCMIGPVDPVFAQRLRDHEHLMMAGNLTRKAFRELVAFLKKTWSPLEVTEKQLLTTYRNRQRRRWNRFYPDEPSFPMLTVPTERYATVAISKRHRPACKTEAEVLGNFRDNANPAILHKAVREFHDQTLSGARLENLITIQGVQEWEGPWQRSGWHKSEVKADTDADTDAEPHAEPLAVKPTPKYISHKGYAAAHSVREMKERGLM